MKKRYGIPALVLGMVMFGAAGSAYAFNGGIDAKALASFSADEVAAIEQADEIRQKAEEEANAVLEAAGVTQDELHDAMEAYREKQRTQMDAALEANDYAAFASLVKDSPMQGTLTEDTFAKLVEIHKLEVAGDKDGAMTLRKELGDAGFMGGPGGRHMGPPRGDGN